MTHPIHPCLWFDGKAAEAADFYCSVFPDSKIIGSNPFVVIMHLNGQRIMALNGGPEFRFNEAISLVVACDTQAEIDHYWDKLTDGGEEGKCGWLKDRFGVSWQVVPSMLGQWMADPDKAPRVMYAFMQMKKFDIETLRNA